MHRQHSMRPQGEHWHNAVRTGARTTLTHDAVSSCDDEPSDHKGREDSEHKLVHMDRDVREHDLRAHARANMKRCEIDRPPSSVEFTEHVAPIPR